MSHRFRASYHTDRKNQEKVEYDSEEEYYDEETENHKIQVYQNPQNSIQPPPDEYENRSFVLKPY